MEQYSEGNSYITEWLEVLHTNRWSQGIFWFVDVFFARTYKIYPCFSWLHQMYFFIIYHWEQYFLYEPLQPANHDSVFSRCFCFRTMQPFSMRFSRKACQQRCDMGTHSCLIPKTKPSVNLEAYVTPQLSCH